MRLAADPLEQSRSESKACLMCAVSEGAQGDRPDNELRGRDAGDFQDSHVQGADEARA